MPRPFALISVYDKEGVVEFAAGLSALSWDIVASEGTAKLLRENKIPSQNLSDLVGEPILGHKVVTLSREVHAALLATETERAELAGLGIRPIDLVCVSLYPMLEEISKADSTRESVRAKTDVGGIALLHAAGKGQRVVVCDKKDYDSAIVWLDAGRPDEEIALLRFETKARQLAAEYLLASATYVGDQAGRLARARCGYTI